MAEIDSRNLERHLRFLRLCMGSLSWRKKKLLLPLFHDHSNLDWLEGAGMAAGSDDEAAVVELFMVSSGGATCSSVLVQLSMATSLKSSSL